jgi:hypothetical protein
MGVKVMFPEKWYYLVSGLPTHTGVFGRSYVVARCCLKMDTSIIVKQEMRFRTLNILSDAYGQKGTFSRMPHQQQTIAAPSCYQSPKRSWDRSPLRL